jgi:integrase/recombinase XerD
MIGSRLHLPLRCWPEVDRALWSDAQAPADFLQNAKPASHWSPDSRTFVEHAYGQWLAFLDRKGVLDPTRTPGARASDHLLREFIVELQGRVAPATVALRTGALLRMLIVLEPERDWTVLASIHRHLKRTAVPSRNKLSRMVAAPELFDLGIRLMETWNEPPQQMFKATRFRNGLLIALLICCPIRAKNLAGLMIGRHLVFDGEGYRLELAAAETKTRRPYVADLPRELAPYIERWLQVHRPALQSIARTDAGRRR